MVYFKAAILEIVEFQQEQQLAWQKRTEELQLDIQRLADLRQKKFKEMFLWTQEE